MNNEQEKKDADNAEKKDSAQRKQSAEVLSMTEAIIKKHMTLSPENRWKVHKCVGQILFGSL